MPDINCQHEVNKQGSAMFGHSADFLAKKYPDNGGLPG